MNIKTLVFLLVMPWLISGMEDQRKQNRFYVYDNKEHRVTGNTREPQQVHLKQHKKEKPRRGRCALKPKEKEFCYCVSAYVGLCTAGIVSYHALAYAGTYALSRSLEALTLYFNGTRV